MYVFAVLLQCVTSCSGHHCGLLSGEVKEERSAAVDDDLLDLTLTLTTM